MKTKKQKKQRTSLIQSVRDTEEYIRNRYEDSYTMSNVYITNYGSTQELIHNSIRSNY